MIKVARWQIVAARHALRLSQIKLAGLAGVSQLQVSRFERGVTKSDELRIKLVDALQSNGIHFILDDDRRGLTKIVRPRDEVTKIVKAKPVDEPKRELPRRSKEDHYRMASRIRGQSPHQEDDGSSWDGDTRFRPEYD